MTKSSLTLILTFCVSLGAACAHDDFVGPRPGQQVLTRLEIIPDKLVLPTRSSSQLTIKAWDQFGTPMLQGVEWADKTSYLSGSPQIAEVSSSGLVTAVALGTAEVAATLTLGGVTSTTSTSVTVAEPAFPPGVYDLALSRERGKTLDLSIQPGSPPTGHVAVPSPPTSQGAKLLSISSRMAFTFP